MLDAAREFRNESKPGKTVTDCMRGLTGEIMERMLQQFRLVDFRDRIKIIMLCKIAILEGNPQRAVRRSMKAASTSSL